MWSIRHTIYGWRWWHTHRKIHHIAPVRFPFHPGSSNNLLWYFNITFYGLIYYAFPVLCALHTHPTTIQLIKLATVLLHVMRHNHDHLTSIIFRDWCVTSCRLFSILFVWFHQEISRESVICCIGLLCAVVWLRYAVRIALGICTGRTKQTGKSIQFFILVGQKRLYGSCYTAPFIVGWCWYCRCWWWRKKKALCDKKFVMQQI